MTINTNDVTDTLTPTTGGMTIAGLICNSNSVSTSFTVPTGFNAVMSGPVTISSGVTVTVSTGSRWVVV